MFSAEVSPFDRLDDLLAAAEAGDDPGTMVEVGGLCYSDDRFEDTRRLWERAFGHLRDRGEDRMAALVAVNLAELHDGVLGNPSASRGWLARARRVLDGIGPCPEQGYYELAHMACDRPDVDDLLASADRALAIAHEYGDTDLEVRALADGGLALVSQGRTDDGFARIDEALATICAGEVTRPSTAGQAFCSMLSSCDRSRDVARVEEWIRLVHSLILDRTDGRPRVLGTHCVSAYGSVLIEVGRWDEAEQALNDALGPDSSSYLGRRIDSTAALARLRVAQGRFDEAADLLAPQEDRLPTCLPLSEVHLRRGEPALAAAVARRGINEMVGDVARRLPLMLVLVESLIAEGDLDGAAETVAQVEALSHPSDPTVFAAERAMCRGRLEVGRGDFASAVAAFEKGLASLPVDSDRLIAGILRLELAAALEAAGASTSAVPQARASYALFGRLSAAGWQERAAALLRDLGVTPPGTGPVRSGPDRSGILADLTDRERDVLELVCRGATNAEIGQELFISSKTVEHHVGRILTKLGARSRTEAAAMVAGTIVAPPDRE